MKPTALLLLAGIAICLLVVMFVPESDQQPIEKASRLPPPSTQRSSPSSLQDVDELQIIDEVVGSGNEAIPGRRVKVHYTGWLYDTKASDNKGLQFDSSRGSSPFQFVLERGEVIRGWDQGVKGMKVGGKRKLIIPSRLAYGPQGQGQIPPNAPLMFEVEILSAD